MRIVVALTGATGAIYGIRFLEALRGRDIEVHLILSKWAKANIELETNYAVEEVEELADVVYDDENQAAAVSSGSFSHQGMVILPCSMKTLAAIACGYADNLIQRAADVCLKEGRKLIVCARETPLSTIHLENMLKLSRIGVKIVPPMPAFYNKPNTIDDLVNHHVARVLDQLNISNELTKRWSGEEINVNSY